MYNKFLAFIFFVICGCMLMLTACDTTEDQTPHAPEEDIMVHSETDSETHEETVDPLVLPDSPLQKWDQGQEVETLQELLNQLSYSLDVSGTFDEQTTWAITDIQLQADDIYATGVYNEDTKVFMQSALGEKVSITPEDGLSIPSDDYLTTSHAETVENPYDVLALINKEHALPDNYIPNDLVIPNVRYPFTEDLPKKQLRKIAADALEDLFVAADESDLNLYAISGYRSYDRQVAIFAANVERHGEDGANNYSARPGQSEHQSGLTMDVTSPSVQFKLVTEFGATPEGIWLAENAHTHGFIIRYLEGREDITQYQYEPWHLRYVGKKVATEIYEQNLTLEEYIQQQ